jgi:tRNA 2-thiouridine synthesizing protein A
MTKKAVQQMPADLTVLVDNETAKNNVLRFLQHSGYSVIIETAEETIQLQAKKPVMG